MSSNLQHAFSEKFESLSGVAHIVPTQTAAADKIASIIHSEGAGCIALAGLPEPLADQVEERCDGLTVLKEPYDTQRLPEAIDAAEVGVTGITFAIAQTGTLVEVSTDDAVRLVSGLPRTYIGIFNARHIIDRYEAAATRLRSIVAEHGQNLVISYISGPSRTGDIELKLTLGVHGPEEAHAVIITGS